MSLYMRESAFCRCRCYVISCVHECCRAFYFYSLDGLVLPKCNIF